MPDRILLTDQYYRDIRPKPQPDFSNYSWPQIDWLDAIQINERLSNYQNLLQEVRKLSRKELISLLKAIFNLPDFKL
jgi:hypothetical protein